MITARRATLGATDKRVRLLQEVLQGIKLLLLFNWQGHYYERVTGMRRTELKNVRKFATYRGVLTAFTTFVPILAATLTFITYALLDNPLDPGTIFSSLQLFNIIRAPLFFFPLVAAACSDGYVSLLRIARMLMSNEIEDVYQIIRDGQEADESNDELSKDKAREVPAINVQGSFTWERGGVSSDLAAPPKPGSGAATPGGPKPEISEKDKAKMFKAKMEADKAKTKAENKVWKARMEKWSRNDPTEVDDGEDKEKGASPFILQDLDLQIKKGSFVAIVGRVASGKSSILQAMTGDMRRLSGDITFGGSVAYAPQAPWIMVSLVYVSVSVC